ncbi:HNH endonuclease [Leptospira neocaledonica]|uniref:HNH nuclease domain-containing protein n=1 Tax=Leptospira neocaledonica TaxID=2023192 RepID=A0A2N0A375_9LEPT|nr:hypothetical protein [Leptospira neocaledonica]PJZ78786.1 hypothetical protein CH365_00710 [Leptospira neocaledonica]
MIDSKQKKPEPKGSEFKFRKQEFDILRKKQNNKCYATGRELNSANMNGSHIIPIRKGGEHIFDNTCLVVEEIRDIKRKLTDKELVEISADVIRTLGNKYGYKVSTNKKNPK